MENDSNVVFLRRPSQKQHNHGTPSTPSSAKQRITCSSIENSSHRRRRYSIDAVGCGGGGSVDFSTNSPIERNYYRTSSTTGATAGSNGTSVSATTTAKRTKNCRNYHRNANKATAAMVSDTGSSTKSTMSTSESCAGLSCSEDGDTGSTTSSGEPNLPYPGFPEIALKYLTQDARPRNWCLQLITNPYPFQIFAYLGSECKKSDMLFIVIFVSDRNE